MLSLLQHRCSDSPAGVLLHTVGRLADITAQPMGDTALRLDLTGLRPHVWIDPRVSEADLNRFLPEVIAAIVVGPIGAPSAKQAPKLVAVS